MFWDDHAPPHFHAFYNEYEIVVNITTLELIKGKMPQRALRLILEWAELHQNELVENWNLCKNLQLPKTIMPL